MTFEPKGLFSSCCCGQGKGHVGCPNNYCNLCAVSLISAMLRAQFWRGDAGLGWRVMRTGFLREPPLPDGDAVRKRNYYRYLREVFP